MLMMKKTLNAPISCEESINYISMKGLSIPFQSPHVRYAAVQLSTSYFGYNHCARTYGPINGLKIDVRSTSLYAVRLNLIRVRYRYRTIRHGTEIKVGFILGVPVLVRSRAVRYQPFH